METPRNVNNIKCLCGHEIWDDELGWLDLCSECTPARCVMCGCVLVGKEGKDFFIYQNEKPIWMGCRACETKYNMNIKT
jgi:hypothetical protein